MCGLQFRLARSLMSSRSLPFAWLCLLPVYSVPCCFEVHRSDAHQIGMKQPKQIKGGHLPSYSNKLQKQSRGVREPQSRKFSSGWLSRFQKQTFSTVDMSPRSQIDGWWTYEFCYRKHVRQFHKEGDKVSAPDRSRNLCRCSGKLLHAVHEIFCFCHWPSSEL